MTKRSIRDSGFPIESWQTFNPVLTQNSGSCTANLLSNSTLSSNTTYYNATVLQ